MLPPDLNSPNFGFLSQYNTTLVIAAAWEVQYFPDDAVTALMKPHQFDEFQAQQLPVWIGIYTRFDEPQAELLTRMGREGEQAWVAIGPDG